MPGASYLISPTEVQVGRVTLEHLHMLDYDGEVCNGDENYDYYQCKHDHLFKVSSLYRLSIENFGPRTSWHCKIFALGHFGYGKCLPCGPFGAWMLRHWDILAPWTY